MTTTFTKKTMSSYKLMPVLAQVKCVSDTANRMHNVHLCAQIGQKRNDKSPFHEFVVKHQFEVWMKMMSRWWTASRNNQKEPEWLPFHRFIKNDGSFLEAFAILDEGGRAVARGNYTLHRIIHNVVTTTTDDNYFVRFGATQTETAISPKRAFQEDHRIESVGKRLRVDISRHDFVLFDVAWMWVKDHPDQRQRRFQVCLGHSGRVESINELASFMEKVCDFFHRSSVPYPKVIFFLLRFARVVCRVVFVCHIHTKSLPFPLRSPPTHAYMT